MMASGYVGWHNFHSSTRIDLSSSPQGNWKETGHRHILSSSLYKICVDQALEIVINQKVNGFNETSHTCSPHVERRRVVLIIIVTQLAVCVSKAKLDHG